MERVPVRSLRNHSAELLERVGRGETLTVTRDGLDVATLGPIPRRPLSAAELLRRFAHLPPIDGAAMRAEIDALIDPSV